MNKITITSINFKYDGENDNQFTSVDIHFMTRDLPFTLNGSINVGRGKYNQSSADLNELRTLVATEIARQIGIVAGAE